MRLLASAALLALLVSGDARAGSWVRPVPGEPVAGFAYDRSAPFEAGARRNVRFAARPGAAVRAACSGRVAFSGDVPEAGRVVTLGCGRWRVTHLGLRRVRLDSAVRAGDRIGVAAGRTVGLGVRRAADPWGYVDPERLLPRPPAGVGPVPASPSRPPAPRGPAQPPGETPPPRSPWVVWPGLAALALALLPAGRTWRPRRARLAARRPVAARSPQ